MPTMNKCASTGKRTTTVFLSEDLVAQAKALPINASQAAEEGVAEAVAEKRAELWVEENRIVIDSSNSYVERHGLPLGKYRIF